MALWGSCACVCIGDSCMKNRGSITLYLVGALLLVGALGTIAYKLDSRGFERGKAQVEAQVAQRDNEALKQALDKLAKATKQVRDLEDKNIADLAAAALNLKKGLDNAEKAKMAALAGVRDGSIKLQVRLAQCTTNSVRNSTSATSPSGQPDNGTTATAVLGEDDSTFLITEASRADKIVQQLTAAQEVIIKDREVCK